MHRLSGPNVVLFIPILIIGIILCAITPNYFGETRILSLTSLLIGELGLSFIPVLALYPKASPLQAALLATVYFLTTLIICFGSWGINNFGFSSAYTFLMKDGEFQVNTYSLFVVNLISLIAIVTNFKLVYDEKLTKEQHGKGKKYQKRAKFSGFQKPLLKHPQFQGPQKKVSTQDSFEDDFIRPFEFEPEIEVAPENLPEESTGKLFSEQTTEKPEESEFFIGEEKTEIQEELISNITEESTEDLPFTKSPTIEKPKPIYVSPFPPSDIKKDLGAIFEQYSSLNAVKKITTTKSSKQYEKKKEQERKPRKPYEITKDKTPISVNIQDEDVHEATFRQITEAEKLIEIKEEIKKELEEEFDETTQKIKEAKTDIIHSLKEELIESLKEEIKKDLVEEELKKDLEEEITKTIDDNEENQEKIKLLEERLSNLNKEPQIVGSMFLNENGNTLTENWSDSEVIHKDQASKTKIVQLFKSVNKQINKTNQGSLYHLLLESQNGTLVLANVENKILTVCTKGTGEAYSGQILRTLSEFEEQ